MTEPRLLFIDIESQSRNPTTVESAQIHPGRTDRPLWTRTDNSFKFNFLSEHSPAPREETPSHRNLPSAKSTGPTPFTGQGSGFAFNFQIPADTPEDMQTETDPPALTGASSPDSQSCAKEEKSSNAEKGSTASEPLAPSKSQKKKKSAKKKAPQSTEGQQKPNSTEGSQGDESTAVTAEQQLQRELDWCIEKLELGMRTQKGTPKQKEEASRALKTLRSSKAPLAKKRQVMRTMSGDYRKKMEDEKDKQFKLIQTAMTSAQVKAVSDSPKKSVFHRRAGIKTQTPNTEEKSSQQTLQSQGHVSNTKEHQEETSQFVFATSKEEFCFNFL
ncbi:UPF0488 protein C8orf33 homolog [Polymixia lowei]